MTSTDYHDRLREFYDRTRVGAGTFDCVYRNRCVIEAKRPLTFGAEAHVGSCYGEARKLRTPQMRAALALDLNTGLRDKELRQIRWEQIDLVHKKALTVGKSKTEAGTGRVIPLNETAMAALEAHAAWYTRRFGKCQPEWFVFPFGTPLPKDPTRPITSFKTAWSKVREKAGVKGRWHDNRRVVGSSPTCGANSFPSTDLPARWLTPQPSELA
jgi:integrase